MKMSCHLAVAVLAASLSTPGRTQAPLPQPQMAGDVPYLNGGAGSEEVAFIKQSMKDYSLALAFSRGGGPHAEYVASVAVTIKDAKGATVFEAASAGPYLLVRLPSGSYSVIATYQNVSQSRPVKTGRPASLTTFVWS